MISLALLPLCAALAAAEEPPALVVSRLEGETAARIQSGVLDPILGAGRSSVFVRLAARVTTTDEDDDRSGVGSTDDSWEPAPPAASTAAAKGDEDLGSRKRSERQESRQSSRQSRRHSTRAATTTLDFDAMRVVVLCDTDVPPKRLETARRALLAVYAPDLKADAVRFEPAEHARRP